MAKPFVVIAIIAAIVVGAAQFLTLFIIQPIGAVPEGRTVVMTRLYFKDKRANFIESADAICERELGQVSLLCRFGVMKGVAENGGPILMRLPYSEFLYKISTGGKTYDR